MVLNKWTCDKKRGRLFFSIEYIPRVYGNTHAVDVNLHERFL